MFYLRVLESEFDDATRRIATMFPQLMEVIERVLTQEVESLAEKVRERASEIFPPTEDHWIGYDRTGDLVESIGADQPVTYGPVVEGYVHAGGDAAPYAKFFLPPRLQGTGGTPAHRIPLTGDANPRLHFMWNGAEQFRRSVNHPGFGEMDFIGPIYDQWLQTLPPHIQEAVDRVISES